VHTLLSSIRTLLEHRALRTTYFVTIKIKLQYENN
jgi:hypothetical protein